MDQEKNHTKRPAGNAGTSQKKQVSGGSGKRPSGGKTSARPAGSGQRQNKNTAGTQGRPAGKRPAGSAPERTAGGSGVRRKKKKSIWQKFKELSGGRKALIISLIVLLVLILTVVVGGYLVVNGFIQKMNYVPDEDITVAESLPVEAEEGETAAGESLSAEELAALDQEIQNNIAQGNILNEDFVYNILLIGVDRRDTSWAGNSDAMMLVSINSQAKKIFITSLMRDTYVNIPGIGNKKLNAAHAHGAGPLLVQTVTQNFRVQVDRYASVDFNSLTSIIDQLGGIPMEVSDAEANIANNYIREMNRLQGRPENENLLSGGGNLHLNGVQATAYARIRYVGNADWERTERQRKVLSAIINSIKNAGVTALPGIANNILPLVTHNIPDSEIWGKIAQAPEIMGYEIVMDRIPYDGLYTIQNIGGQGMLVPNWSETVARLQSTIYATH